jgi:hypothetical protein
MDNNKFSALLGICIVLAIIEKISHIFDNNEKLAIASFFKSELFSKLQDKTTGLWHLSSYLLSEMYEQEIIQKTIEYPEEQS